MKFLRTATYSEYVTWYLEREAWKTGGAYDVPRSIAAQHELMIAEHSGKVRDWFIRGEWYLVEMDGGEELGNLIFLDDSQTRSEGLINGWGQLDYRIVSRVVSNALQSDYLLRHTENAVARYYNAILEGKLRLEEQHRLVLCDPDASEQGTNPSARFYLHDGAARGLAYMLALSAASKEPVFRLEAFYCKNAGDLSAAGSP